MRLNIEITKNLQDKIKNYINKKEITIKDLVTQAIEEKISKKIQRNLNNFTVGIICGGPSSEKGISLNSARSVADHIEDDNIKAEIFYIDENINFYKIDRKELYSNTPLDFEFKLSQNTILSKSDFIEELKKTDIAFPVIHGEYGEDGQLQELLERNNIPFVGSSSKASKSGFNKISTNRILAENGFYIFPLISFEENKKDNKKIIDRFFELNKLKKAIVKPANGGSSIGVYCVYSPSEALEKVEYLLKQKLSPVIVEPFCAGREFTVVLIENLKTRKPVALIPSGIEMVYDHYQIFDYRRKYLPTTQTRYATPANFKDEEIEKIQNYSEEIYNLFGFSDCIRMDGWLLNDGRIWFSDINIASGMEQNSFVFQQSSRIGMDHGDFIRYILKSACLRYGIDIPEKINESNNKKQINVLFGGANAERQVSLMSGTNVWLKLRKSHKYYPKPFLLDKNKDIWKLPYCYTLSHTVEEIYENCINAEKNNERTQYFVNKICKKLDLPNYEIKLPKKYSFDEFINLSKEEKAFVFIALHGGKGEDGTIQEILTKNNIPYNGSEKDGSSLGMDKYKTGIVINNLHDETLISAPKIQFAIKEFINYSINDYERFWNEEVVKLRANSFIIKPGMDGSSAGAARIYDCSEFKTYVDILKDGIPYIPANTFKNQQNIIEMPSNIEQYFVLEAFIETDDIFLKNGTINYAPITGWLELTVGLLEKDGNYHSFYPSITVAENKILTIEEKFQGGTGVNLTPPPENIISESFIEKIRKNIEKAGKIMNLKNYARLDIFVNVKTEKIILIEANTLPALTPSTVIFQQALKDENPMNPKKLLEEIVDLKDF